MNIPTDSVRNIVYVSAVKDMVTEQNFEGVSDKCNTVSVLVAVCS